MKDGLTPENRVLYVNELVSRDPIARKLFENSKRRHIDAEEGLRIQVALGASGNGMRKLARILKVNCGISMDSEHKRRKLVAEVAMNYYIKKVDVTDEGAYIIVCTIENPVESIINYCAQLHKESKLGHWATTSRDKLTINLQFDSGGGSLKLVCSCVYMCVQYIFHMC